MPGVCKGAGLCCVTLPNKWRETAEPMHNLKYPTNTAEMNTFIADFDKEIRQRVTMFGLQSILALDKSGKQINDDNLMEYAMAELDRLQAIQHPTLEDLLDTCAITYAISRNLVLTALHDKAAHKLEGN